MDKEPNYNFVGLQNPGATCYINCVLQQLYMLHSIRLRILAANVTAVDTNDDYNNEMQMDVSEYSNEQSLNEYNIVLLKEVKTIFEKLEYSTDQYYVPEGLWKHLKIDLQEQDDAVVFFMKLVQYLDEALKALFQDEIMATTLGGLFLDEKICQGCPHRYFREEPFSVISVDIKNLLNLTDSLNKYVKGELLETYYCEKCDKKVNTVKRMCIKKLPPILAIQLKRFDYDSEKQCSVKCNDYFEFPHHLDMEPYTVSGLAKLGNQEAQGKPQEDNHTKYELTGIIVHSGEANSGHYYSCIQDRSVECSPMWYKFNDVNVTEYEINEMKTECFGGNYEVETDGQMSMRTKFWNAYMLLYTKVDSNKELLANAITKQSTNDYPTNIDYTELNLYVQQNNLWFSHIYNQDTLKYFKSILGYYRESKTDLLGPISYNLQGYKKQIHADEEELSLFSIQLVSTFIFNIGISSETKKSLKKHSLMWYSLLQPHICKYASVRYWFAKNILFKDTQRFTQYLLDSRSLYVRLFFIKLIVDLAHHSLHDNAILIPAISSTTTVSLSDCLIIDVLSAIKQEIENHKNKHFPNYFKFFYKYCSKGTEEILQLLKLNVTAFFISVTIDESLVGTNEKYKNIEIDNLHNVVSLLVRSCDCTDNCLSYNYGFSILTNPYAACKPYIIKIPQEINNCIFEQFCYLKKIIEHGKFDNTIINMFKFVCWENSNTSIMILTEILSHIIYMNNDKIKVYLELLNEIISINDSWQIFRIKIIVTGNDYEEKGLFDLLLQYKYQKKDQLSEHLTYLIDLLMKPVINEIIDQDPELKQKILDTVQFIQQFNESLTEDQYNTHNSYIPESINLGDIQNVYQRKENESDFDNIEMTHTTNTMEMLITKP